MVLKTNLIRFTLCGLLLLGLLSRHSNEIRKSGQATLPIHEQKKYIYVSGVLFALDATNNL